MLIIRCNAIILMQYLCNDNDDMQCPFCSHRIMQCNIRSAQTGHQAKDGGQTQD